ncbi:phosphoglycerate mutase (2,3-diphosphoglycerate-dependent) [Salvia divinorum]|uniref:Phosphoglycerate mutase (2,3-diphosphoglycerate-dependent) n=1 Tax=Salvia divinorum TaxID=28513 RepID=A0ABD1I1N9_SALDI
MATAAFHQAVVTPPSRCYFSTSCLDQENGIASIRSISKGVKLDITLTRRETYCSRRRRVAVTQASASHSTTVPDPVLSPSSGTPSDSYKKSSEAALILIRHGESMWDEKNLFTGSVDVPHSARREW